MMECPTCATVQPPAEVCSNPACRASLPRPGPDRKTAAKIRRRRRVREGERRRDTAINRVKAGAPKQWLAMACECVRAIVQRQAEFTTDEVWDELGRAGWPEPVEPRAMGAVMRMMSEEGLIARTDRVQPSTRPECHRRPVAVWRRAQA